MADEIQVDTYKLRTYSQRLSAVNTRVEKLNGRISSLYRSAGLLDLLKLIRTTPVSGQKTRIGNCSNYLSMTASDFARIEAELVSKDISEFSKNSFISAIYRDISILPLVPSPRPNILRWFVWPNNPSPIIGLSTIQRVLLNTICGGDRCKTPKQLLEERMKKLGLLLPPQKTGGVIGTLANANTYTGLVSLSSWLRSGGLFSLGEPQFSGKLFEGTVKPGKISGSWLTSTATTSGTLLGIPLSGTFQSDVLGGSISPKLKSGWKKEKGYLGAEGSIAAEGYVAKGKLSTQWGILSKETTYTVGKVGGSGSFGLSLFKDHKLSPSLDFSLKGETSAIEKSTETKIGSDKFNGLLSAKGSLLNAEGKFELKGGVIHYEDGITGEIKQTVGFKAKAGAEATLAKGSVSGGFTVFGVKITGGVTGKAGTIGGTASIEKGAQAVSGKIGAGLIFGGDVEVNIDWSGLDFKGFKLWK